MSNTIVSDHAFTEAERQLLQMLAGCIVPPSEAYGVPGADDDQIFTSIIDLACTNVEQIKSALHFSAVLLGVDHEAMLEMPQTDVIEMLEGRRELAPLVSVVMQCYYCDDRVMQALGKPVRAPFPEGYEVEQGDWSMLEAVQARGKLWRDT